jgi:hypothetical protein
VRYKDARKIADRVLALADERAIREALASILKDQLPELPQES